MRRELELDHAIVARCKGFGHRWDDIPTPPDARHRSAKGFTALHFRCTRCGMIKCYVVDNNTGEGRGYYYPAAGYSSWRSTRRDWKVSWAWEFRRRETAA
jgi:hypothetical protein